MLSLTLLFCFLAYTSAHLQGAWEDSNGNTLELIILENTISGTYNEESLEGYTAFWEDENKSVFIVHTKDRVWYGLYEMSNHETLITNSVFEQVTEELTYTKVHVEDHSRSNLLTIPLTLFAVGLFLTQC